MLNNIVVALLLILPLSGALYLLFIKSKRDALDVCDDLKELSASASDLLEERKSADQTGLSKRARGVKFGDELSKAGLLDSKKRKKFLLTQQLIFCGIVFCCLLPAFLMGKREVSELLPFLLISLPLGYLVQRSRLKRMIASHKEQLEFFLPLVMERLVMGAEAGLDILPALQAIVKVEELAAKRTGRELDAVTVLVQMVSKLTDSGLSFGDALSLVAESTDSSALRHAFIHLGLAQSEGGELIMPLRELSDATQLYFQETVEETIAKMPAKATMPLLCTFTGLVLCFLTPAMLQVISVLEKSVPK